MGYKKTCLECNKSFNREIEINSNRLHICPDCGQEMILMNHKFRPPKKNDIKAWELVKFLVKKGFIYQHIVDYDNNGIYVPYPEKLSEAKIFVLKYANQSILNR